jgi:hypothetical protein
VLVDCGLTTTTVTNIENDDNDDDEIGDEDTDEHDNDDDDDGVGSLTSRWRQTRTSRTSPVSRTLPGLPTATDLAVGFRLCAVLMMIRLSLVRSADLILALLQEALQDVVGAIVTKDIYDDITLSLPDTAHVAMREPTALTASLAEAIIPEDPTSDSVWRNMTFNGYAPSGNASAPVVYVNYGCAEDMAALQEMKISLSGAIALARYGSCFRGMKAKYAQEAGAVGLLIYSDPIDDGSKKGPVYPNGPWRPASGVQRGSVQFLPLCPGNPTGREAICGYSEEELIPKIPVQPISSMDACPILCSLNGNEAPAAFQGGCNCTYFVTGNVIVEVCPWALVEMVSRD